MKLYEGFSTGFAVILQEKLRSALTMLGIVIGIAAVLAMLAIGDGAKRIVMQEFEKYGGHFFDLVGIRGSGAATAYFQTVAVNT